MIKVDIVTAEREVYSEEVDLIVAPGVEGQLGILPHHAPLMTMLQPGELRLKKGGEEILLAISGGFLEVRPDRVVILADTAERAEEIDVERAEKAKQRAKELLEKHPPAEEMAKAEVALRRALARIKVAEKWRKQAIARPIHK